MTHKTYTSFSTGSTPQSEPIPGTDQRKNNAGGYSFKLDDWKRLERFLVIGSSGGTFYVDQRELTRRNAEVVLRCLNADPIRTVDTIVDISHNGRALSNDPALFALAMVAGLADTNGRCYALQHLSDVARIGTHLFHFAEYVQQFRGWGRALRTAVASWYTDQDASRLAYQSVKYQQRDGWSHRDLLRLSHPSPPTVTHNAIFHWITQGWDDIGPDPHPNDALRLLWSFERAKRTDAEQEIIRLITNYGLTREMIPTHFLNSPDVWSALLEKMPLHALVRNLGKMTSVGLLKPLSPNTRYVAERLVDRDYIHRSRLHPLAILVALRTYASGSGYRGSLTWTPASQIVDALDEAFYLSFDNVEPTGKRVMQAIDVSSSMTWNPILPSITPRVASAALALTMMRTEPANSFAMGFSHELVPLAISPRQRLDDVINVIKQTRMGRTDCALPMRYALRERINVDAFVVLTDSETWYGSIHPVQALRQYRDASGINAKLIVVGMESNGFSIADPDDPNSLDIVGFSTSTPSIINAFIRGEV